MSLKMLQAFDITSVKNAAWLTLGLFSLGVYYHTELLRLAKFIAFECGYTSSGGKGIIHGPLTDTRFTRFINGVELSLSYYAKYGPIYRVFCGTIPEIVITDPEDVRMFYQDAKLHTKSPNMGFGAYVGKILGQCVGVKHNEDWRRLRSHIDGHFSPSVALESFPSIIGDVNEWLDAFQAKRSNIKSKRFQVDAHQAVGSELILKIIGRTLFGDLLDDKLVADLCDFYTIHERLMNWLFFGRTEQWMLASYLPTEATREAEAFARDWSGLMHRAAKEAEAKGITTTVSELYKRMQEGKMSFLEFSHSVDEILFNNIDVVANATAWSVVLLGQHPDVQARLMQEVNAALANDSYGSTTAERIEGYLRKTDTLLHYCCLEAGRLQPTSFYALPELTSEPKLFSGYMIPTGTSVVVDVYTLNRRSPVWGNDGDAYRPERFMGLLSTKYRYSMLRFGFGPRKCVGQHFGDKIVKSVVLQIFQRYTVTAPGKITMFRGHFLNGPTGSLVYEARDSSS